jgi:hypothetical protein
VDYSLHVMHTFLATPGKSRRERVRCTMLGIAAAVLLGAFSTAVGVVVLAGSKSEIIRTFFKLLLGTVLFGGVMGLVALPVLLALIGPAACLHDGGFEGLPEAHALQPERSGSPTQRRSAQVPAGVPEDA